MDNFAQMFLDAFLSGLAQLPGLWWQVVVANPWPWVLLALFVVLGMAAKSAPKRRRRYR